MRMPLRGSLHVPHFKGDPHELQQYFADVELSCKDTQLFADEDRIRWAVHYARHEDAELWSTLPSRAGADWSAFKAEVTRFYPGAEEDDRKYLHTDLIRLVEAQAAGTCHARDNQSHPRPKISPLRLVPLPSRLLQIAEITRASPLRTPYVI